MNPNNINQNQVATPPAPTEPTTFGTPDLSGAQREATQARLRRRRRLVRWISLATALVLILLIAGGTFIVVRQRSAKKSSSVVDKYEVSSIPLDSLNSGNQSTPADQATNKLLVNGNLVVGGKISLSAQAIDDIAAGLSGKVNLQDATPGVPQVGNVNLSGTLLAGLFQGSGAGLTSLNASNLATGTVNNARLSTTVTQLGQTIPLSAIQPTILSSLNSVSNNGGNIDIVAGSNVTVATNGGNKTITISATSGGGDISGVTAGDGLQGGGTTGTVTLAVDATVARLSGSSANGQTFAGNNQLFKNASDSTTAFVIQNAAGTNNLLTADNVNGRLAVNQATANYTLDVNGDVNLATGNAFRIGGTSICTSGGCAAASGSGNYIQNSASQQTGANFNIESGSINSVGGVIKGKSGQVADLLQLQDGFGNNVASFSSNGGLIVQTTTDWAGALSVRNSFSQALLNVDTTNSLITLRGYTQSKSSVEVGLPSHDLFVTAHNSGGSLPAATYEYRLTELVNGGYYMTESIGWPSTPTTVTTVGSAGRVSVNWSNAFDADGFRLYRTDDGGVTWSSLDLSGSTTGISDDGTSFVWTPSGASPPPYEDFLGASLITGISMDPASALYFSRKSNNNGAGSTIYYDLINDNLVIDSTTQGHYPSNGGLLLNTSKTTVQAALDSTSIFAVQKHDGSTILNVDSTNSRVGIGTATPTATLDVRPATVGELGYFLRQQPSSTADMLQLQNSSSVTVFNIDATGHLASGESLPGVPIIGVDPNSGADKGDLVNTDGPLKASAGAGLTLNISAGSAYTADINGSPTKVKRCNLPSDTTLSLADNTTKYIYVLAGGADSTTGTTCTFAQGNTPDTFNASQPTVVIAKVVTAGGSITSVADTRFFAGGSLTYVQTAAGVEAGMIVTADIGADDQVQTTTSAAATGVEGIIVVGNNAAGRAIMMTSGSAWAQAVSGAVRANCAGTSTTAGVVNNVGAAVNVCVGRVKTSAAAATPSVLVQVAPN